MQLPPRLQQQIAQAVRTSMRIEGYRPTVQPQIQAQAKTIMERMSHARGTQLYFL